MTSVLAIAAVALAFAIPTGSYRTTITAQDLANGHAGVSPVGYAGTWTLQIQAGHRWLLKWSGPPGHPFRAPPRGGGYTQSGSTYVFTDGLSGGSVTTRAVYRPGTLRFVVSSSTSPSLRVLFAAHRWRKVG